MKCSNYLDHVAVPLPSVTYLTPNSIQHCALHFISSFVGVYADSFRRSRWFYLGEEKELTILNDPRVSLSFEDQRTSKASSSGVSCSENSTSPQDTSMSELDNTVDSTVEELDMTGEDGEKGFDSGSDHVVLRSDSREDFVGKYSLLF